MNGAIVGWMKWTPVLYKEPLRISAAVAEKLNLPTDALTKNFVVDESEAKHDALIEGLGVQLAWEILRNLPNTTEVKPIIYQFVMRDPFSLTRITFKEYHIAYEICVNPSVHKAEGDFTDMWNAEQERISELIEEGSAFYYDPNSFHLQPRLYSHGIDDAPVGLAFWNHLRNRLRTAEDIANNAEFLKIMIQMPGYFVPLVNSGLSIRDYFYCEGSTLLACLAALGADVSSDVLLFMKIPVVAAKIAKGYTKTKKGAVGLKKAIEQGKDAEVYLTNVAEIIKKKASLGQVGAGALNFGLAAIYAAEGDLSMAAARVLAGSSDVGVFRISKKSLLFVPFGNIKTICADSKIGVKLRRLASNVEEFRQCKLSKITNGVENLPRQIDNAEVDRILTATGRNNPAGREIMEKYAEYMGHIPNNQKNIPSNTIAKTRKFYEEVLQPLGVSLSNTDDIIITEQVIQSIKSQGSLEARAEMAYKAWRDALKGLSPGYSMGGRHITLPGEIKIKMNDGSIRSISACDLGEEAFDMLMHTFNSTYLEEVSHALQFNLPTTLNANGYPWPPVNLISEYTSMKQWIENPANIDRIMELTQFNYPAETMRRNIERLSHVEVDPFILASRSANTRARRAVEMASYAKSNYPERDFFVLWKYETSGEFLGYSGDELLNTIRTKWAGY